MPSRRGRRFRPRWKCTAATTYRCRGRETLCGPKGRHQLEQSAWRGGRVPAVATRLSIRRYASTLGPGADRRDRAGEHEQCRVAPARGAVDEAPRRASRCMVIALGLRAGRHRNRYRHETRCPGMRSPAPNRGLLPGLGAGAPGSAVWRLARGCFGRPRRRRTPRRPILLRPAPPRWVTQRRSGWSRARATLLQSVARRRLSGATPVSTTTTPARTPVSTTCRRTSARRPSSASALVTDGARRRPSILAPLSDGGPPARTALHATS